MKYIFPILLMLVLALAGCSSAKGSGDTSASTYHQISQEEAKENKTEKLEKNVEKRAMKLMIGETQVPVTWEENESVNALMELAEKGPLTIQMSMYGGFEQVGAIGQSLPRADVQTTTQAGDIVLYSGDQIVVFYGENAWAYTRLGRITDKSAQEMTDLLGNGDVTITIEME